MTVTWRRLAGVLLVAHGFAHTLPGMRAAAEFDWLPTLAWAVALAGFLGAGAGLLGVRLFRPGWDRWAAAGVFGSAYLLISGWPTPPGHLGVVVDLAVLLVIAHRGEWLTDAAGSKPGRARRLRDAAAILAIGALTALVLVRPWHMRWGSTAAELRRAWPGDELAPGATYLIQHAVTIDARPAAVWPWLAQLGQERGGFYSYAWLENLIGLGIRNAERIHPEWQRIEAGDSIYATPPNWLGMDRRLGWRVARAEPERVLVLEQWGAFILEPEGDATRLIVRTRGAGTDRPIDLALAPLGFLLFEPAHFVMERKMLLELKRRAEGAEPAVARGAP